MPLSGMLAAGLAVNEAFLFVNGGMPAAGRRALGLSLWRPGPEADWLQPDESEPPLTYLPSRLWLIGLGHLGQAYLWGLGLLPDQDPADVALVLQDIDVIAESTESTSIITDAAMIGQKKTRAMAAWAERRGFATSLQERMFAADFTRQAEEPAVALCGLDNGAGRQALDQVGFDFVVEAGLGRGHRDFRAMRLHVLPGRRAAADIWKQTREGRKGRGPTRICQAHGGRRACSLRYDTARRQGGRCARSLARSRQRWRCRRCCGCCTAGRFTS